MPSSMASWDAPLETFSSIPKDSSNERNSDASDSEKEKYPGQGNLSKGSLFKWHYSSYKDSLNFKENIQWKSKGKNLKALVIHNRDMVKRKNTKNQQKIEDEIKKKAERDPILANIPRKTSIPLPGSGKSPVLGMARSKPKMSGGRGRKTHQVPGTPVVQWGLGLRATHNVVKGDATTAKAAQAVEKWVSQGGQPGKHWWQPGTKALR